MLYRATVADAASRHGVDKVILKSKTSPRTTTVESSTTNNKSSSSSTRLWATTTSRRIKKRKQRPLGVGSGLIIMSIAMTIAIVISANLFMLSQISDHHIIHEGSSSSSNHNEQQREDHSSHANKKPSSDDDYKRPLLPGSIWSTRKFPTYNHNNNNNQNHDQENNSDNNNINIDITHLLSDNETSRALELCGKFYYSTLMKATKVIDSEQVYVATGDIDMMWIRDSVVQFSIYLSKISTTPWLRLIVEGEIKRNAFNIIQDPYANAYRQNWKSITDFNMKDQLIGRGGYVGTRNYELDSGAYYLNHIYDYFICGVYKPEILLQQPIIYDAVNLLVNIWIIEQNHDTQSEYRYFELPNNGRGTSTTYTGMTWTGFRPSDDPTQFGYLIPANIHAAAGLERVLILNERIWQCNDLETKVVKLLQEIEDGINKYGIVNITKSSNNNNNNNNGGNNNNKNMKHNGTTTTTVDVDEHYEEQQHQIQIYAYEVDGMGGILKKYDDANVPSLLSIPLLGWSKYNPQIYKSTRSMLLSKQNPVYYEGSSLRGIGSRHTRSKMIWPMALIIQGLTEQYALDDENDNDNSNTSQGQHEKQQQQQQQQMMLKQNNMAFQLKQILISSSCKTKGDYSISLHESVHVDNTCAFSRYWFEWANALFVVYVETVMSSQRNQCSTIGNELYQREISQKIPPKETTATNTNRRTTNTVAEAAAAFFHPHIDPYKNDRNLPQYFQNIAAGVQYDSYEPLKQIKDKDF